MQNSDAVVPPHSLEAEQSVLGALLLSGSLSNTDDTYVDEVFNTLRIEDFYRKDHQTLFEAIKTLHERDETSDILTISEHLTRIKKLEMVGGDAYLGDLVSTSPSLANILTHAELVRERSVHRQLIAVGNEVVKLGYYPEDRNLKDLVDEAEARVFEIAQQEITKNPFKQLPELLTKIVENIDILKNLESDIIGFSTGFTKLDSITAGLQRGDLIILAGKPSMGKTTLAVNIAQFIASHSRGDSKMKKDEYPEVGFFSMEMSAEQLVLKMLSSMGSIKFHNLRTGHLADDEWDKLLNIGGSVRKLKLYIDDQSGITVYNLRGRARRLKKEKPNLSLLVIDYLQLLSTGKKHENRTTEVTEISRILKEMAREFEIPIIALSQLRRGNVNENKNKRPVMSDLRDSGSIEQDADVIIFVHRPEVNEPDNEKFKGKATLIIGKQRNGAIGDVKVGFQGEFSRFVNLARESDKEIDVPSD